MAQEKNDPEFLQRIRSRDPACMNELVRLHTQHLFRACRGMGCSETEAEDLTQTVWLTFFDVVEKFEGRSSVRTFLFGILYNKSSELFKQRKRAEPTENIEEIIEQNFDKQGHWLDERTPQDPGRLLEALQTGNLIETCLEKLPPQQKMAFLLREVEDEVSDEICNTLRVSATNLGVLLFRARNQLRECLERKMR